MEAVAHRRIGWRVFVAPLVVAGLLLAYLAYARDESPARHAAPRKLSASDLMLAATRAKKGIFLEYDGVTGPPSSDHTNHALLLEVSWSVGRTVTGGAAGAGRQVSSPTASDLTITKNNDQYTVPLISESLQGHGAPNAIIYFTDLSVKGAPFDYLEIDLSNVIVSSFKTSSNGDLPTESLTFNFDKVLFKYQAQNKPPSVLTWDLVTNVIT